MLADVQFQLEDYLNDNGWTKRNNIWRKGNKSLFFTKSNIDFRCKSLLFNSLFSEKIES